MLAKVKQELTNKVGDASLVDNLLSSFQKISQEFVAQDPVGLLQNTGLYVESALRIAEHLVFGTHTPLADKFEVDICIKKLEGSSGSDGLRIHLARLARSIYDFRTRKKAVHLKAVDPHLIDANLVFNISTWTFIEILKESRIPDAENAIRLLVLTKIPLVQQVEGILRTTNPKLNGPKRIILLLYSSPDGLTEGQLLEGTKNRIKNFDHLKKNLSSLDKKDQVHKKIDGKWVLFGKGNVVAEEIIAKYAK